MYDKHGSYGLPICYVWQANHLAGPPVASVANKEDSLLAASGSHKFEGCAGLVRQAGLTKIVAAAKGVRLWRRCLPGPHQSA